MRKNAVSSLLCLALACGPGPLPPESPKTEPDQRATEIPILAETSGRGDKPRSSSSEEAAQTAATETSAPVVFANVGLSSPSDVAYDPQSDAYLVSNLGKSGETGRGGYISKLSPSGTMTELRFVADGVEDAHLSSPSALGIQGETLLVADANYVRKFSLVDGKAMGEVHFPKAARVSTLTVAGGIVYVAAVGLRGATHKSPLLGALYRLEGDRPLSMAVGEKLGSTIALTVVNNDLLSVSSTANELSAYLSRGENQVPSWTLSLPGVAAEDLLGLPGNQLLLSSSGAKLIYGGRLDAQHQAEFVSLVPLETPARMAYDSRRQRLLLALPAKNEVRSIAAPKVPTEAVKNSP